MTIGVYEIKNIVNGKSYIGSSINIKTRWYYHRSNLKRNNHHCSKLQNSWNKYGKENFIFQIVEELTTAEKLIEREQYYLDNTFDNFNSSPKAGDGFSSIKGIPRSKEWKRKISEAQQGEKTSNSKLKEKQVKKIIERILKRDYLTDIAKDYNVSDRAIQHIKYGSTWKHLITDEQLELMAKVKNQRKGPKGHKFSEEHKKKLSYANQGKKLSEETKKKVSLSHTGENSYLSKLAEKEVVEIRGLYKQGFTLKELAERFDVHFGNIHSIVKRKTWKYIN